MFKLDYYRSVHSILFFKLYFQNRFPVVFYNRYILHSFFSLSIIKEIAKREHVVVFCGDRDDHLFRLNEKNITVLHVNYRYEKLFALIKAAVFITPATTFYAKNRPKNSFLIHQFHSLASINHIYTEVAFDGYDGFFAAGEHHLRELEIYHNLRDWKEKKIYKIGYPKILPLLKKEQSKNNTLITVLLAPSWGEYNLISHHGVEITNKILEMGYNIIVRPHSHSYNNDKDVIKQLKEIEQNFKTRCRVENANIAPIDSLLEADIMISDWSGVAYEFSFSLLKPVLFIDIPQKINNSNKKLLDAFVPMEFYLRERIGKISDIKSIEENIHYLIQNKDNFKNDIEKEREKHLYNLYNSDKIATNTAIKIRDEQLHFTTKGFK